MEGLHKLGCYDVYVNGEGMVLRAVYRDRKPSDCTLYPYKHMSHYWVCMSELVSLQALRQGLKRGTYVLG